MGDMVYLSDVLNALHAAAMSTDNLEEAYYMGAATGIIIRDVPVIDKTEATNEQQG